MLRSEIRQIGERSDLRQPQFAEPIAQHRNAHFGGVTAAPESFAQYVADLDIGFALDVVEQMHADERSPARSNIAHAPRPGCAS